MITLGFMQQKTFQSILANTKKFTEANEKDYDAIFLIGGQGPMYTFKGNRDLQKLFIAFYEAGKPSGVVCHATTCCLKLKNRMAN